MKITKDEAVAICVGVGFSNAPHWSKERLMSRILDFSKSSAYVDLQVNKEVIEDADEAERLDDLLEKLREANGDVQPSGTSSVSSEKETPVEDKPETTDAVVDDDEPDEPVAEDDDAFDDAFSDDSDEEEEVPPPVEAAPDPKDVPVDLTTPRKPKPKPILPGRDRFNSKIGTKASLVNAVLTEEFQTPKEISKASGVAVSQVYSQTKKLQQKGFAIIGEDKCIKLAPEMYLDPVPEPIEMTGEDPEQEVVEPDEPEWDEDSPTEKPVEVEKQVAVEKQSEAAPSKPQKSRDAEQPWSGDSGTKSSSSSISSPRTTDLPLLKDMTQFVIDAATEFKELLNRY